MGVEIFENYKEGKNELKNKHLKQLKENDNFVCKEADRLADMLITIIARDRDHYASHGCTYSDPNGLNPRSRINRRGPPTL